VSFEPIYELSKPCIRCAVCWRYPRFWFVTAHWNEPVAKETRRGTRFLNAVRTAAICSPACADHWAVFNDCPMYDRHGRDIRCWLAAREQVGRKAA
jgi:hypothetical protein